MAGLWKSIWGKVIELASEWFSDKLASGFAVAMSVVSELAYGAFQGFLSWQTLMLALSVFIACLFAVKIYKRETHGPADPYREARRILGNLANRAHSATIGFQLRPIVVEAKAAITALLGDTEAMRFAECCNLLGDCTKQSVAAYLYSLSIRPSFTATPGQPHETITP